MRSLLDQRKRGEISDEAFMSRAKAMRAFVEGRTVSSSEIERRYQESLSARKATMTGAEKTGETIAGLAQPFYSIDAAAAVLGPPEAKQEAFDLFESLKRGFINLGAMATSGGPANPQWNKTLGAIGGVGILEAAGAAGALAAGYGLGKTGQKMVTRLTEKELAKKAAQTAAREALRPPDLGPKGEAWYSRWQEARNAPTEEAKRIARTVVGDEVQPPPPVAMAPEGELPKPALEVVKETAEHLMSRGEPPKDAARQAMEAASGKWVALTKANIQAMRQAMDFTKLPLPARRAWLRLADEVKREGLHNQASSLAKAIIEKPFPISDKQHVSLVVRAGEILNHIDEFEADAANLVDKGLDASIPTTRAEGLRKELDDLLTAADLSGTESGRSLGIRRMMMNRDTWDIMSVIRRAKAWKGKALEKEEMATFKQMVEENDALKKQLEEAQMRVAQSTAERDRMAAESVVREQSVRRKISTKKEAILSERADVKNKLRDLGLRVNDISGPTIEGSYLIGRLALSYIKEGVDNLSEVVARVLKDVPDLTERDVWQSLNAKNPKAAERTEVQLRIRDLKREAKLLDDMEALTKGEEIPSTRKVAEPPYPSRIEELNDKVSQLKQAYARREFNTERLNTVYKKIDDIRDQIANGYRNVKAGASAGEPEQFMQAKAELEALRKEMRLGDKLQVLNEQIRTGDIPPKTPRIKTPETMEVERLQLAIRRQQNRITAATHELKKKNFGNYALETMNALRSIQTTTDLGTTLRQNLLLTAMRPKAAMRALKLSIQAAFSEDAALKIDKALREAPENFYREKSGLFMPEVDEISLMPTEEHYQKSWIDKFAPVKASKRQFITATNLLRAAAFDEILKVPNATTDEMRMWADFVNKASGRGDLGSFSRAANVLSVGFFAPRFTASRFQAPAALWKYRKNPLVRKMVAKELGATVGAGITAMALLSLNDGVEVSANPRSPDFGKIKIGNTRYDIWGGFQQTARLVAQMGTSLWDINWKGETKPSVDPLKIVERFAEFKAAPAISAGYQLWTGKNLIGQEVPRLQGIATLPLPLVARDIADAIKEGESEQAIPASLASFLGMGVSTYEKQGKRAKFRTTIGR